MSISSMEQPAVKWWFSWPAIIIACLVFWPIGIALILKRVTVDKSFALFAGRIMRIIGWIALGMAALGIFAGEFEMFVFFVIAGALFIYLGKRIKTNAEKSKQYISLIANQQITSLDEISSITSTSYEVVKKDLQEMINKGYFKGAVINESTRELVLARGYGEEPVVDEVAVSKSVQMKQVSCKGCGAYNTVGLGETKECEYCGTQVLGA